MLSRKSIPTIATMGIDIGKNSFHVVGLDRRLHDCVRSLPLRSGLTAKNLVSEASMQEILTSGKTNEGSPAGYGFGWYHESSHSMCIADHEGDWIGLTRHLPVSRSAP